MQSQKHLSKTWAHILLGALGLLMCAISAYLTNHYYQVHFPKSLSVGTFCDISRFWNCDSAAFSPLSNIFDVPTAFFGAAFGLIILFGALIRRALVVRTNFFLALINLFGCVILFAYSLFFLHGLCPGCTVYYALSLATVVVFLLMDVWPPIPSVKVLLPYIILMAAAVIAIYLYNHKRFKQQDELLGQWVEEMRGGQIYDDTQLGFVFPLIRSTKNFSDAPLRITLFSDFQCPWCKLLGKELEKMASRYDGQINVQYMFFPLDSNCNDKLSTPMHPQACAAARLTYCAKDRFVEVHDDIIAHQDDLSGAWLLEKAGELGVKDCYESEESRAAVKALVDQSDPFQLDSAPTMFINGRKISGLIPKKALVMLFDALVKEKQEQAR